MVTQIEGFLKEIVVNFERSYHVFSGVQVGYDAIATEQCCNFIVTPKLDRWAIYLVLFIQLIFNKLDKAAVSSPPNLRHGAAVIPRERSRIPLFEINLRFNL